MYILLFGDRFKSLCMKRRRVGMQPRMTCRHCRVISNFYEKWFGWVLPAGCLWLYSALRFSCKPLRPCKTNSTTTWNRFHVCSKPPFKTFRRRFLWSVSLSYREMLHFFPSLIFLTSSYLTLRYQYRRNSFGQC